MLRFHLTFISQGAHHNLAHLRLVEDFTIVIAFEYAHTQSGFIQTQRQFFV
jgi:hypothetical protein